MGFTLESSQFHFFLCLHLRCSRYMPAVRHHRETVVREPSLLVVFKVRFFHHKRGRNSEDRSWSQCSPTEKRAFAFPCIRSAGAPMLPLVHPGFASFRSFTHAAFDCRTVHPLLFFLLDTCSSQIPKPAGLVSWSRSLFETMKS